MRLATVNRKIKTIRTFIDIISDFVNSDKILVNNITLIPTLPPILLLKKSK